jgi:gliding motility-associated lipoprotein GldH
MKHLKAYFAVFMLLAVLWSCDSKRLFEAYHPLDSKGWHKDSMEQFVFEITDTTRAYNVNVNIRNHGDYAFSNVWMFIDIVAPDSTILRDTVEFELAEPNGRWYGRGIGDLYDAQYKYRRNVVFPLKGTYQVNLQQAMRDDVLKGISDVGIRVETF